MPTKLVWRTESGQAAWQCANSGLPQGYRRILDLIAAPESVASVITALGDDYPAKQVADWIEELETLCFIHASRTDELPEHLTKQAA